MAEDTRIDNCLINLPVEILEHIFSFCDVKSLTTIAKTCKKLRVYSDSEVVWKEKWLQVRAKFHLKLELDSKSSRNAGFKNLTKRTMLCFRTVTIAKNAFHCDCVVKEVNSTIAYDVGSATSWICWVGRFDKRGCPSMVAHFKNKTQENRAEPETNIDKLNLYLVSQGHPRVSHNYVVGKDAKILSAMYPDLYKSDLYPVFCQEPFPKDPAHKSISLPDMQGVPIDGTNSSQEHSAKSMEDSPRRKSAIGLENSRVDYVITATQQNSSQVSGAENHGNNTNQNNCVKYNEDEETKPFELHHAIINGDASDIDDFELILRHLFRQLTFGTHHYYHLHNTPMVVMEPPNMSKDSRDKLVQMMFEKLKIPRFCLHNKAVSLAPCLGLNTYLVIDSGSHSTVVSPVIDMHVHRQAVQFKPVGGYHVSYLLADFITKKGLIDKVLVDSFDSRAVKEECFVSYNPNVERKKHHSPRTVCVQKPGGLKAMKETHKVDIGTERYLACEDMYLHLDLPTMIHDAVHACRPALHRSLLSRLILTGGNTQLTGFANRLARDLKVLMPKYADVIHIVQPATNVLSRALNAWTVHYKAAPLAYCEWISKEEYIVHGVDVFDHLQHRDTDKDVGEVQFSDPFQHQA